MKRDHSQIKSELAALQQGGVIRPVDVLEFARDPETALHACFEWDDDKAAHEFRLEQARKLLRVYVTVEQGKSEPVRAYVSLKSDRQKEGGGYRAITDVLSDDALRNQLLSDALDELRAVQSRYKHLQKLAKVWRAVDEAVGESESDAA